MKVNRLIRGAIGLLKGTELKHTEESFQIAVLSGILWFKVCAGFDAALFCSLGNLLIPMQGFKAKYCSNFLLPHVKHRLVQAGTVFARACKASALQQTVITVLAHGVLQCRLWRNTLSLVRCSASRDETYEKVSTYSQSLACLIQPCTVTDPGMLSAPSHLMDLLYSFHSHLWCRYAQRDRPAVE